MKILILSASPTRDAIVDELISEELKKFGHEVSVRPCLREGRAAITDELNKILDGHEGFKPDTVVTPPIRNPYSADMVNILKGWGLGVVSRHTEPSCDKKDFEKICGKDKKDGTTRALEIFGRWPYTVDAEIVWSKDEAEILNNNRQVSFKTHAVGAFTVDAYKRQDVIDKYRNVEEFRKKFGFDDKPVILICSAWGFADSAPDLHIEDIDDAKKDIEGRQRHFEMIRSVSKLRNKFNIIVTIHPNIYQQPYDDLCGELKLPIDSESTSFYLKLHSDAIIHAGSTMAIGAHFLGIPAYQYGDINTKTGGNWWSDPESAISKVSPYFNKPQDLVKALEKYERKTNASISALADLEAGRFGKMDGQATLRAAKIIDKVRGRFRFNWPKSINDYSQLVIQRSPRRVFTEVPCKICGEKMTIVNESWLNQATNYVVQKFGPYLKEPPPQEFLHKFWLPPHGDACPWCSARFFRREG